MQCLSCDVFVRFFASAEVFSKGFFDLLGPLLVQLLLGLLSVWILWISMLAIMGRAVNWDEVAVQFVRFLVVIAILGAGGNEWWMLADALFDAASGVSAIAFGIGSSVSPDGTGDPIGALADVLRHAELALRERFVAGMQTLWSEVDLFNFGGTFVMAAILTLVFLGLVWVFLKSFLTAVIKIVALYILSPFWIAAAAFPSTTGTTVAALRMLLMSCLQLVMASGAVGLMAAILTDRRLGADTRAEAANYLLGGEVLQTTVVGAVYLIFYAEMVGLPAQVLQVLDQRLANGRLAAWAGRQAAIASGKGAAAGIGLAAQGAAGAARAGARLLKDTPLTSWLMK